MKKRGGIIGKGIGKWVGVGRIEVFLLNETLQSKIGPGPKAGARRDKS